MILLLALLCYFNAVIAHEPSLVCKTPNGETGSCMLLFKCPILIKSAVSDDPIAVKFIKESACGNENFMVCCGTAATYINKQNKIENKNQRKKDDKEVEENRKFVLENLLPGRVYCGLQHTDDYIYTKDETSVDEFPWMVYIPSKTFIKDYYLRIEANCVGMLISNRYVLTHKDCNAVSVMIGQHHIYKDISCIATPYDIDDCTNPLLNEFVEDYISSETSNMALLRLKRKISFSDYVRPICLPLEQDEMPKSGAVIVTSGWGEEQNTQGKTVKLKKRVKHTLLNQEECENANPVENPICGERFANSTNFVCPRDIGGGLMYRNTKTKNLNWVVLGIIAASTTCAKRQPVVAERITPEIRNWILDNIKP